MMEKIRAYITLKSQPLVEKIFLPCTGARILVIAPHPDDESIGCGQMMLKFGGGGI